MPRYLLRGPFITFLIVSIIVGIGVGVSSIVSTALNRNVQAAHTRGYEQGYNEGYDTGIMEGSEDGFQEGSKQGILAAGAVPETITGEGEFYFHYNPSYDEIMDILAESQLYSAQDILDHSRTNGIRAAYVRVPIARPAPDGRIYLYQLVAFETVDKGLIVIEPRSHREVKVEVGASYSLLNGFPQSPFDDTITKVTFVW